METAPLKGMKDFLPSESIVREEILEKIKECFELFGFRPLQTPALERWEILSAKRAGGEEILKETYNFEDKGGRKVGLRYDLTVPLARVIANNPNLPLPFKRYQIQPVWRYGDVAKGRLREFLQCDIDIVGAESMIADAEVIACANFTLRALGFKDFSIRINNRKILSALVEFAGVKKEKVMEVLRTIDKLDKIGEEGVRKELKGRGVEEDCVEKIMEVIGICGKDVLEKVKEIVKEYEEGKKGVEELEELKKYLELMNVENYTFDMSLARGLDYYTGPIFEITAGNKIGSIAGGGRYDELIGIFSGRKIPATGISLGVERIIAVMRERGMIKERKSKTKVFVAGVGEEVLGEVIRIVKLLREEGINSEFDLRGRNLSKQLEYASKLDIPFVLIIGRKEIEKGVVKLRNMSSGEEREVEIKELIEDLKRSYSQSR